MKDNHFVCADNINVLGATYSIKLINGDERESLGEISSMEIQNVLLTSTTLKRKFYDMKLFMLIVLNLASILMKISILN